MAITVNGTDFVCNPVVPWNDSNCATTFVHRRMYRLAVAIFARFLVPALPKTITCLENYADLLRKMSRPEETQALENCANLC